jgi:hypothetical protein
MPATGRLSPATRKFLREESVFIVVLRSRNLYFGLPGLIQSTPGKPPVVGHVEGSLSEAPGRLAIPPISISIGIYEYSVR